MQREEACAARQPSQHPLRSVSGPAPARRQVIEAVLKDKVYDEAKVPIWVDQICDKCMESLTELNKPFKYIGRRARATTLSERVRCAAADRSWPCRAVSCIIMQRNGAGIHTAQSCHWDIRFVRAFAVSGRDERRDALCVCVFPPSVSQQRQRRADLLPRREPT